jgi:hypothetical protein
MSDSRQASNGAPPPTSRQMRYLRDLAMQRGESFVMPRTFAEARAQIDRLKRRRRSSRAERQIERDQLSREMATRGDAAAVRDAEIVGYGSSARWR